MNTIVKKGRISSLRRQRVVSALLHFPRKRSTIIASSILLAPFLLPDAAHSAEADRSAPQFMTPASQDNGQDSANVEIEAVGFQIISAGQLYMNTSDPSLRAIDLGPGSDDEIVYVAPSNNLLIKPGGTLLVGDLEPRTEPSSFTVNGHLFNQGVVRISNKNGVVGNKLHVRGDYSGTKGSVIYMSTNIGAIEYDDAVADISLFDQLVIDGDSDGESEVIVKNLGERMYRVGEENGPIKLITVHGNSQAEFVQKRRIVAGAYDYVLRRGNPDAYPFDKDAAKHWFLNSYLLTDNERESYRRSDANDAEDDDDFLNAGGHRGADFGDSEDIDEASDEAENLPANSDHVEDETETLPKDGAYAANETKPLPKHVNDMIREWTSQSAVETQQDELDDESKTQEQITIEVDGPGDAAITAAATPENETTTETTTSTALVRVAQEETEAQSGSQAQGEIGIEIEKEAEGEEEVEKEEEVEEEGETKDEGAKGKKLKANVVAPQQGTVMIRPEAGSYNSNAWAANTMFQMSLNDRLGSYFQGEGHPHRGSAWIRYSGSRGDLKDTSGQLHTKGDKNTVMMGVDMFKDTTNSRDQVTLGLMGGYGHYSGNTRSNLTRHNSVGKVDGFGVGLYGTYQQHADDQHGVYLDSWLLWNQFNNRVKGDDLPVEKYKSKGLTASLDLGYNAKIAETNDTKIVLQPHARVVYQNVHASNFVEDNGTHIEFLNRSRVQTALGLRIAAHIPTGLTSAITPHLEANWLHTNKGYGVRMNNTEATMDSGRRVGQLKLGVEGELNQAVSLNVELFRNQGNAGYRETGGNLAVKYRY